MASTRDLVVQVTADTSGLASGMAKGARSLADMEKQARQAERQIKKIGEAGASFQRLVNDFAGVTQAQNGAARASAEAFQEFARLEDAVNDLRGSLDPAYAATKRYEAGLQQLDTALAKGVISSDSHAASVRLLDDEFARATKSGGGMAQSMRGVSQQLSQVGQQTMATGNFVQALAIQLPDIGLAFGAVGAAAGLLAGVALPMLMSAFTGTGEASSKLKASMDALQESVRATSDVAGNYSLEGLEQLRQKYGEIDAQVLQLVATQRQFTQDKAMADATDAVRALADEYGAFGINLEATGAGIEVMQADLAYLGEQTGLSAERARDLVVALRAADAAGSFQEKADALSRVAAILGESSIKANELTGNVLSAWSAMKQLANSAAKSGWLSAMIGEARELAGALWNAAAASRTVAGGNTPGASAATLTSAYQQMGATRSMGATWAANNANVAIPKSGGGGGGGGGGSDAFAQQFEALQNSLKTKEQIEIEAYARNQEALQLALKNKMVTLEQYHSSVEALQQAHQERMSEIDVWKYGTGLEQAQSFFGSMATALQGGNERMAKIAQKFAAAEALINAYRAGSQVLADPSLPFFAKIPAALSIIGAGMKMVSAIKGGGSSGGGTASAATSSATTAQQAPVQVNIAGFSTGQAIDGAALVKALKEIQSDRGIQII